MKKQAIISIFLIVMSSAPLFESVAGGARTLLPDIPVMLHPVGRTQWQRLNAVAEGDIDVRWDSKQQKPVVVVGKIPSPTGDISETAARQFLADYADLFRVDRSTDDLLLARQTKSLVATHFVFEQQYQGLAVFGASVTVHFDSEGYIRVVTNDYVHEISLETITPAVTMQTAIEAAREHVGLRALRQGEEESADLVVYPPVKPPRLAWQVVLPALVPLGTWEVFIDAQTGELIDHPRDVNRYREGQGRVYGFVNAVVATQNNKLSDLRDSNTAVPSTSYRLVPLPDLNDSGYLDGLYVSTSGTPRARRAFSRTTQFLYWRADGRFEEVMAYYYIDYCQRYIQSLGFTTVNNRQQIVGVNTIGEDNSFYDPRTKRITFGSGGVDDAEDAEVIWHEYGHAIQDDQVPGFGLSREAGAMSEGFGDYWAASLSAQLSLGFQDDCVADWDAVSYSDTDPPCLRRVDGKKHYPEDLIGQVHADGEIWSAALWEIRSALGGVKADTVILQSHFFLSRSATFRDGAQALLTAATLLKYSDAEKERIHSVFRRRGIL